MTNPYQSSPLPDQSNTLSEANRPQQRLADGPRRSWVVRIGLTLQNLSYIGFLLVWASYLPGYLLGVAVDATPLNFHRSLAYRIGTPLLASVLGTLLAGGIATIPPFRSALTFGLKLLVLFVFIMFAVNTSSAPRPPGFTALFLTIQAVIWLIAEVLQFSVWHSVAIGHGNQRIGQFCHVAVISLAICGITLSLSSVANFSNDLLGDYASLLTRTAFYAACVPPIFAMAVIRQLKAAL